MRYVGQGHEIAVALDGDALAGGSSKLARAFEDAYAALYGRTIPGMAIEALTWSLILTGPRPELPAAPRAPRRRLRKAERARSVFDADESKALPYGVLERALLAPGDAIEGPALIVEDQTTTVVSSAFDAHVDARGNLILERRVS
ncbi:MAG TPA: hypothetical protein VNH64_04755, partial [Parvularculaceae bacterium]|nr:hypothetical protein [Parvularculaceae bacterium]